jgi:hypothetical protein
MGYRFQPTVERVSASISGHVAEMKRLLRASGVHPVRHEPVVIAVGPASRRHARQSLGGDQCRGREPSQATGCAIDLCQITDPTSSRMTRSSARSTTAAMVSDGLQAAVVPGISAPSST